MDKPRHQYLFSLCQKRKSERRKIRKSREDKVGRSACVVGGGKDKNLKFLRGCYCPRRVFKAGTGSLHRKTSLGMLTVTLHSL